MHVSHICHPPASWVGCVNGFHVRTLDRVRGGYSFIDAHASFLDVQILPKKWIYGEICLHRSSFSLRFQSLISLKIASLVVRLAISVLEKILDSAKLKTSVYRSSVEGEVTVVVSIFGVEGVARTAGADDGSASSANLTLEGVDCFTCIRVSTAAKST